MLGFLPTRAYRPGTPGATTFLSPLSGTFNYGWDSFKRQGFGAIGLEDAQRLMAQLNRGEDKLEAEAEEDPSEGLRDLLNEENCRGLIDVVREAVMKGREAIASEREERAEGLQRKAAETDDQAEKKQLLKEAEEILKGVAIDVKQILIADIVESVLSGDLSARNVVREVNNLLSTPKKRPTRLVEDDAKFYMKGLDDFENSLDSTVLADPDFTLEEQTIVRGSHDTIRERMEELEDRFDGEQEGL